jgi:hypothetical protein
MPGDYCVWLDENESFGPVVPKATNGNPEQSIELVQLGARLFPFVNGKLLAKSGRLHCQTVPRHEKRPRVRQHAQQKRNHHSDATQPFGYISKLLTRELTGVLMTDSRLAIERTS